MKHDYDNHVYESPTLFQNDNELLDNDDDTTTINVENINESCENEGLA